MALGATQSIVQLGVIRRSIWMVAIGIFAGAIALVAGYIPARQASRIDPMVALRNN